MSELRDSHTADKPTIDNPSGGLEQRKCSYCGSLFVVLDRTRLPFCSVRCQEVDLGKWLSETYGLPWEDPHGSGAEDFLDGLED